MIEDRYKYYLKEIMKHIKYKEDEPEIDSILDDMQNNLFIENRLYIKELEQIIKQLKEELEKNKK